MKKVIIIGMIVTILLIVIAIYFSFYNSGNNISKSVYGKVSPVQEGIKIILVRNLSLVAETVTDEEGNFIIKGLDEEKYGLLFIYNDMVYIYNDAVNTNWIRE